MVPRVVLPLLAAAALVAAILWFRAGDDAAGTVNVLVPINLSAAAAAGRPAFAANCAACHGDWAGGTDKGPPLVHSLYEPNHHTDASFRVAVRVGVRPHHWSFGPMFPLEGVTDADLAAIIAFVRELQRANGIF